MTTHAPDEAGAGGGGGEDLRANTADQVYGAGSDAVSFGKANEEARQDAYSTVGPTRRREVEPSTATSACE